MSKQNQPEHKGKSNTNFTKEDWFTIPERLIYDAVVKEGKPTIARILGVPLDSFRDWFKFRKIDIPIIRNANYYNARKPLEEQGAWEEDLSREILSLMEKARSERLKEYEDGFIEVICPTCGKLFKTKKDDPQKYCSSECVSNRVRSEEEKAKLSKSCMGREAWNKGRKCTEEEKEKMSKASKEFWARKGFKEKMSSIEKESWKNQELREKHCTIMKACNTNEDKRKRTSESVHKYNMNLTPEDWTNRYIKAYDTRKQKGTLYTSDGESSITEYVKSLGFNPIKYVTGNSDTRFEIDCYIPEKKIGIEFNGVFYHSVNGSNKKSISYHFNKTSIANQMGIELIHIWEDQWQNDKEIIKDIIASRLGVNRGRRIYARKCEVREITSKDYCEFCVANHIQGHRQAKVKLGLYYNNELVQIASFGTARSYTSNPKDKYEWEWIRSCSLQGTNVIGGTSKLFNYFISTYKPKNIMTYCDYNLFNGKGYEALGFEFLSYTGPDLFFVKNSHRLERINRNPYANKEHKELVKQGKLFECHGCGSKKFVWYAD